MTRFSLRDVFWLTLVVGMGVGWWMHNRSLSRLNSITQSRVVALEALCKSMGVSVKWDKEGTKIERADWRLAP